MEVSNKTIKELESLLDSVGVETGSYSGVHMVYEDNIVLYGYGETHNLGKGWTYRVDRPSAANAKPHIHIDHERNNIHGVENVDGTASHGKTFNDSKIPKKVQKKVKESKDYKKAKADLKNIKKVKREISRRKINLKKRKGRIITAGIFIVIVGVAFFSLGFLPTALLLI